MAGGRKMALYVDIKKKMGDFTLETQLEAQDGVTGILGTSGCGKSMTLRCIAGILKPDEGRIELDGTVFFDSDKGINLKPQQRHVGLLFQNYALFPNMTVYQNLMTGILPYEKNKKKAADAVKTMLERFGLKELEKHRPNQLSGGQQQRTALARILLSRPRLLMLDEPFSALDGYLRWNLELELRKTLEEFGGSTLFVSHSREEIYRICDRVCVMENGKSGEIVPVKQLFENPVSRAEALLSGCQNFSAAVSNGAHQILASDWGVIFEIGKELPEKFSCVGIRNDAVHLVRSAEASAQKNTFFCKICHVVEDIQAVVLMAEPEGAEENCRIRVDVPKDFWAEFIREEDLSKGIWIRMEAADLMVLR
jgi:molybdate transport system ATP-binding protein